MHLVWRGLRTHTLFTDIVGRSNHIKETRCAATNHAHGQSAALQEGKKLETYQSDKMKGDPGSSIVAVSTSFLETAYFTS